MTVAFHQTHLSFCPDCAKVCEDFALILDSCRVDVAVDPLPPNSQALWCRINNIIESEVKAEPVVEEKPKGWFSRRFTFSQAASAVVGIALISSLLTVVGVKNYFEPTGEDMTSRSSATETTFEKVLSKVGLIETPQQARMSDFRSRSRDRLLEQTGPVEACSVGRPDAGCVRPNLNEIDQAVSEYTVILRKIRRTTSRAKCLIQH